MYCHIPPLKTDNSHHNHNSDVKMSTTWWRHQMETFSALLALCAGNSPVPVNSPHKGQWRGALMFTLICTGINDWVNNREAGDLRRHLDHYDVSVMMASQITSPLILYSHVYWGGDQRKHQSSASLAFVMGIRRWPMNSLHKEPVTRKMFPFDGVIMFCSHWWHCKLSEDNLQCHQGSWSWHYDNSQFSLIRHNLAYLTRIRIPIVNIRQSLTRYLYNRNP